MTFKENENPMKSRKSPETNHSTDGTTYRSEPFSEQEIRRLTPSLKAKILRK